MSDCPTEEQLAGYMAGACSSDEIERIRAHVGECAQCASWVADAAADDDVLKIVRGVLQRAGKGQTESIADGSPNAEGTEAPSATSAGPDPLIGRSVGNYRIMRAIGRGGMGAVYEAEQQMPRRIVALKIIRPGAISPNLLRRFEHEAQVLGKLEHSGIATIFEAGTFETVDGTQPFFAMELVKGEPLTEYAVHKNLGIRQRLELLVRIADAIQHAHQKGVIHRDLKPANILVTEAGQPKVLDFGVARATDADIQTTTLRTDIGQLIGTIPYMSPEQVSGDPTDLDTRSDVYALGVIAYELLTGCLPHDLKGRMVHEAVRVIREDDPTPLSSTNKVFRGDIEIIVAKALEKDKARRYKGVSDFAADIHRYLHDEPIIARPASTWYQVSKFTRRNKALVGGVTAVFLVLIAGVMGTSVMSRKSLDI